MKLKSAPGAELTSWLGFLAVHMEIYSLGWAMMASRRGNMPLQDVNITLNYASRMEDTRTPGSRSMLRRRVWP
jgi:hypothetical protein